MQKRKVEGTEMKQVAATAIWLTFLAAAPANAQNIEIMPNGSRPSTRGSAQNFTGSVIIEEQDLNQ